MSPDYCEFCHTATGLHLPDCPSRAEEPTPDPYADNQQPALWGSMWGTTMDGRPKPQGRPEDIPTETITTRKR